jgi:L-lactate dehydrogenase
MDLNHAVPFAKPTRIWAGGYEDCAGAAVTVITAGANQKPGETRLDLVHKNASIFASIVPQVVKHNPEGILLVATNPVDVLTYVSYKISGMPVQRVIGSGTILDTARFRYLLSQHFGVDARSVHGFIVGEHGDTEVPAWSLANIAGIPMDTYCDRCDSCIDGEIRNNIYNNVKNAAYQIIEKKGATYYAVALAVRRIVEAILRDENSILTVSSLLEGEYGLQDICLSLPSIVNSNGIEKIMDVPISGIEKELLVKSGNSLKEILGKLSI